MTKDSETLQDEVIKKFLSTNDLYVSSQQILDYTMGEGVEMTKEEVESFSKNKKKRKAKSISCGGFFHKGIYLLSNVIHYKMKDHPQLFPRVVSKQKNGCSSSNWEILLWRQGKNAAGGIFTQSLIVSS